MTLSGVALTVWHDVYAYKGSGFEMLGKASGKGGDLKGFLADLGCSGAHNQRSCPGPR